MASERDADGGLKAKDMPSGRQSSLTDSTRRTSETVRKDAFAEEEQPTTKMRAVILKALAGKTAKPEEPDRPEPTMTSGTHTLPSEPPPARSVEPVAEEEDEFRPDPRRRGGGGSFFFVLCALGALAYGGWRYRVPLQRAVVRQLHPHVVNPPAQIPVPIEPSVSAALTEQGPSATAQAPSAGSSSAHAASAAPSGGSSAPPSGSHPHAHRSHHRGAGAGSDDNPYEDNPSPSAHPAGAPHDGIDREL